jgi:hypothetical protein
MVIRNLSSNYKNDITTIALTPDFNSIMNSLPQRKI